MMTTAPTGTMCRTVICIAQSDLVDMTREEAVKVMEVMSCWTKVVARAG